MCWMGPAGGFEIYIQAEDSVNKGRGLISEQLDIVIKPAKHVRSELSFENDSVTYPCRTQKCSPQLPRDALSLYEGTNRFFSVVIWKLPFFDSAYFANTITEHCHLLLGYTTIVSENSDLNLFSLLMSLIPGSSCPTRGS